MVYRSGDSISESSEVVFFLGAGASVKAGVPTTFSFVNEYIESIKDSSKRETIKKIVETLEQWKRERSGKTEKIDIELLLETLTKLKEKDEEPLLPFYPGGNFILEGYFEKEPLINDLKDFIKSKAIVVSEDKIRYLEPFRDLIEEIRPLDIISVNYDTCIEQFCNFYRLTYQDGFDVHWNPTVFQSEHNDIRLYKIHGSVMWYQSDRGGYIKLPVMTKGSKIQLISGEKAENLMLYPMRKWDFAEPLLELLVKMKHLLESESCKFLIIVGYSFRDEHITRILIDAARKNRKLHLILIDPNANEIYLTKLKYYDFQKKIPSPLDGRVICLPYLFEKIFPLIKNHYLKKLNEGIAIEDAQNQIKIRGEKADWIACITSFADAEFVEKNEVLLKRESIDIEIYWTILLEVYLKMAVNLIANGEISKGNKYFKDFCDILKIIMLEKINVDIFSLRSGKGSNFRVEIQFNYHSHYDPITKQKGGSSSSSVKQFTDLIDSFLIFLKTRVEFGSRYEKDILKIILKLEQIKKYFDGIEDGRITIDNYLSLRKNKIQDFEQIEREISHLSMEDIFPEAKEELTVKLLDFERGTLRDLLD